ncbi:MAG: glycosyltransferase family 4 protein [Acidobacteria bacterium]|nr:glycosyltransferase family 4 protein [Acidobacteriota bacterium]
MVTTFYPPYHFGGDALQVYRLSEALAARGHQVDVVHSVDAFRLHESAEPEATFAHHANIRRHALRSRHPAASALVSHQLGGPGPYAGQLRRILADGDHDVIHFHNVSLTGGPAVLRLGRGIKLYTAHEYWLVCPTHVLFRFDREACTRRTCLACTLHSRRPPQLWRWTARLGRCLEELDCLLLPSRFSRDRHQDQGIEVPMEVLPHFVPDSDDEPDAGPPPERPYFLYAGRLEKLKGVQDLIELFTSEHAADLLIAGDGGFGSELRRMANDLPHVRFLGAVHPSELRRLYRSAVAVLVPSLCYESFGLTPIEAFQQGCPAIVRHHGALPELIEQSGAGFTFESIEECAKSMRRLLTTEGLRENLGARGRQAVRRHWSADVHLERYLGLIENQRRVRPRAGGTA